jgi:hypothetical protein
LRLKIADFENSNETGKVARCWYSVKTDGHAAKLLEAAGDLEKGSKAVTMNTA